MARFAIEDISLTHSYIYLYWRASNFAKFWSGPVAGLLTARQTLMMGLVKTICDEHDAAFYHTSASFDESDSSYLPWKRLLIRAMQCEALDSESRQEQILSVVDAASSTWLPVTALLNPVFGTTFEESRFLKKLDVQSRAEARHRLLVRNSHPLLWRD